MYMPLGSSTTSSYAQYLRGVGEKRRQDDVPKSSDVSKKSKFSEDPRPAKVGATIQPKKVVAPIKMSLEQQVMYFRSNFVPFGLST